MVLIATVLGSGITLAALSMLGAFDPPPTRIVIEKVEADSGGAATITTVVDRLRPSIVQIEIERPDGISRATGVIYRSDGYVITTADAVRDARSITVTLTDGRQLPARLVGIDATDDIAVLSITGTALTPVVLGNPDTLAAGDEVVALSLDENAAAPLAEVETVAANGRRFDATDGSTLHDMIQATVDGPSFDDALLVGRNGAVLGIFTTRTPEPNTDAAIDPAARFATPIDFAVRIADEIVATGEVEQPWLGVTSEDLDSATTARLGRAGTRLTEVATGGPADGAGLRPGDIIVTIDAAPITSATSLVVVIREREIGVSVAVVYIRDGAQRTTTATLSTRP